MKVLIIYASKTGTTEKCAQRIKKKLLDTTIININKNNNPINIESYELIIVGTPIRMGMIDKHIKSFLHQNKKHLQSKKTAYFICCGFSDNFQKYYKENFPQELLKNALVYDTFGGEINLEKQKGVDKLIMKLVQNHSKESKDITILEQNIDKFIQKIK